jgi:hypothetical protein
MTNFEIGKEYHIQFPMGQEMLVKLDSISYFSNFPNDYIFEFISGNKGLVEASPIAPKFAIPEKLVEKIKII